jgi:hypothetical protein
MSEKRPVKRGSFGTHLDELIRHFPDEPEWAKAGKWEQGADHEDEERSIHDRLFESAWRKARDS